MYSFTVYQSKTQPTFRVVAGEHVKHADAATCTVRVYQGAERQDAIDAAYSGETDAAIKSQIARFGVTPSRKLRSVEERRTQMAAAVVEILGQLHLLDTSTRTPRPISVATAYKMGSDSAADIDAENPFAPDEEREREFHQAWEEGRTDQLVDMEAQEYSDSREVSAMAKVGCRFF